MNPFTIILGVFLLVRMFNKFMEGYADTQSPIKTITVNNSVRHALPVYNYANSSRINDSLLHYYSSMLNLNQEPEINIDIIEAHYYQIIDDIEHSRDLGLRVNQNIHDLIAAREYMTDMCRYFGNRN